MGLQLVQDTITIIIKTNLSMSASFIFIRVTKTNRKNILNLLYHTVNWQKSINSILRREACMQILHAKLHITC